MKNVDVYFDGSMDIDVDAIVTKDKNEKIIGFITDYYTDGDNETVIIDSRDEIGFVVAKVSVRGGNTFYYEEFDTYKTAKKFFINLIS